MDRGRNTPTLPDTKPAVAEARVHCSASRPGRNKSRNRTREISKAAKAYSIIRGIDARASAVNVILSFVYIHGIPMNRAMDVYVHGNSGKRVDDSPWFLIGLADEGKGDTGSFFFSKSDLRQAVATTDVSAVSIWIEHGTSTKEVMGTLAYWWVDDVDGLYIVVRFEDSARSRALRNWVATGLFTGISMGYKSSYDFRMFVQSKTIYEISIVHDPFHKKCRILQIVSGGGVQKVQDAVEALLRSPRTDSPWDALGRCAAG